MTAQEDAFIKGQAGASVSQLTTQMGKLSVGASGSSSDILPVRPAFGHAGQEVILWANYFKLETKSQPLYKYSLIVSHQPFEDPAGSSKGGADRKPKEARGAKLQRIITAALAQLPNSQLATEFKAQVVSLKELEIPASNLVQVEYVEPGRSRVETWNVNFSKTIPIRLDELVGYLSTMKDPSGDANFPKYPDELDALGVIIGHTPRADPNAVSVGRGRSFATDDARRTTAACQHTACCLSYEDIPTAFALPQEDYC